MYVVHMYIDDHWVCSLLWTLRHSLTHTHTHTHISSHTHNNAKPSTWLLSAFRKERKIY